MFSQVAYVSNTHKNENLPQFRLQSIIEKHHPRESAGGRLAWWQTSVPFVLAVERHRGLDPQSPLSFGVRVELYILDTLRRNTLVGSLQSTVSAPHPMPTPIFGRKDRSSRCRRGISIATRWPHSSAALLLAFILNENTGSRNDDRSMPSTLTANSPVFFSVWLPVSLLPCVDGLSSG